MGRFGIGARVRDWAGDEATIIGKRKGERQVRYDNPMYCQYGWFDKSSFTPIDDAPTAAPATEWLPKVGDRVRGTENPIGYDVEAVNEDGTIDVSCLGFLGDKLTYTKQALSLFKPMPTAAASTPLIIEAGKFYLTRDGRKVGPITREDYYEEWPFSCPAGKTYRPDGTQGFTRGILKDDDLVTEWVDKSAVAATNDGVAVKVKVGNKVWDGEGADIYGGTVRTVAENGEFQIDYFDGSSGTLTWTLDEWEHHEPAQIPTPEPAAPPAKFKVGDTIERTGNFADWAPKGFKAEYLEGGMYVDAFGDKTLLVETQWSLANSAPTGAAGPSFIVARLTPAGLPRPNARPRVHATLAAAEQEAQRLADRLGDEFAVYQRVSVRDVDAGPVPKRPKENFQRVLAGTLRPVHAFGWSSTKQGWRFWSEQNEALTPAGRAILRKWIAEAEQPKVAA